MGYSPVEFSLFLSGQRHLGESPLEAYLPTSYSSKRTHLLCAVEQCIIEPSPEGPGIKVECYSTAVVVVNEGCDPCLGMMMSTHLLVALQVSKTQPTSPTDPDATGRGLLPHWYGRRERGGGEAQRWHREGSQRGGGSDLQEPRPLAPGI